MVKVLILGGVGFVGRNMASHIISNNLADYVRVCDKVLPATAHLGSPHKEAFESDKLEYKQCNLNSQAGMDKAFALDDGKFDYVFNCAAETKYGQTEEVYREKVLDLSKKAGETAAKHGVTKFIELSTAQVYDHGKKPSDESAKLKPWNKQADFSLQAENELKKISGLPLIILRPCVIYGVGDTAGISPRIIIGAVYKKLNSKMKLLYSSSLKLNTVHVHDVCRAMWHCATSVDAPKTFNLADKGDTDQGKINALLKKIFKIETGFHNALINNGAKLDLKMATEVINDKHLKPWADICKADNILNTPLTPYIDTELLYDHALSINGSAIESTGFSYEHTEVTEEAIREQIKYFVDQSLFPPSVIP